MSIARSPRALRLTLSGLGLAAGVLASACTQPLEESAEALESTSTPLACAPTGAGCSRAVEQIAAGQWQSNYSTPSGIRYGWFWDANVWLDIAVAKGPYEKVVGVHWTTDGWSTVHDSRAVFEKNLTATHEQWGIDLTPAAKMQSCFWCTPVSPTFEYAIYAAVGGEASWDNNGGLNHSLSLHNTYGEEP